jgi:hypothetical protein
MHDSGEGFIMLGRGEHSVGAMFSEYYRLVEDFTARKITFDSDKLPAFSGMAQSFHTFIGGHYLAGIWSSELAQGLLWEPSWRTLASPHVRQPYRAPSWSWLVTNEPVSFGMSRTSSSELFETEYVELVSHEMSPKNTQNPYGEVNYCSLTLKGLTMKLVYTKIPETSSAKDSVAHAYFDEGGGGQVSSRFTSGNNDHLLLSTSDKDSQDIKRKRAEEHKEYVVLRVRSEHWGARKR